MLTDEQRAVLNQLCEGTHSLWKPEEATRMLAVFGAKAPKKFPYDVVENDKPKGLHNPLLKNGTKVYGMSSEGVCWHIADAIGATKVPVAEGRGFRVRQYVEIIREKMEAVPA